MSYLKPYIPHQKMIGFVVNYPYVNLCQCSICKNERQRSLFLKLGRFVVQYKTILKHATTKYDFTTPHYTIQFHYTTQYIAICIDCINATLIRAYNPPYISCLLIGLEILGMRKLEDEISPFLNNVLLPVIHMRIAYVC